MVEKFMVRKFMVEEFMVEEFMDEEFMVEALMVEKSGVEAWVWNFLQPIIQKINIMADLFNVKFVARHLTNNSIWKNILMEYIWDIKVIFVKDVGKVFTRNLLWSSIKMQHAQGKLPSPNNM